MKERTIKCGDIYWLELDNPKGNQYLNRRPYLVVDSDDYLTNSKLVCMVPLTSNLKTRSNYDVLVRMDGDSNLKHNSLAKLDHLYTFNRWQLIDHGGNLSLECMKLIHLNLRKHFDL